MHHHSRSFGLFLGLFPDSFPGTLERSDSGTTLEPYVVQRAAHIKLCGRPKWQRKLETTRQNKAVHDMGTMTSGVFPATWQRERSAMCIWICKCRVLYRVYRGVEILLKILSHHPDSHVRKSSSPGEGAMAFGNLPNTLEFGRKRRDQRPRAVTPLLTSVNWQGVLTPL
jgi:hypothetical protein